MAANSFKALYKKKKKEEEAEEEEVVKKKKKEEEEGGGVGINWILSFCPSHSGSPGIKWSQRPILVLAVCLRPNRHSEPVWSSGKALGW